MTASGHVVYGGRVLGSTIDIDAVGQFTNAGRSDAFLAKLGPL